MIQPSEIDHTLEAARIRTAADDLHKPLSDKARESAKVLAAYVEARDDPKSQVALNLPAMKEREAWAVGEEVAALFAELFPDWPDVRGWAMSYHDIQKIPEGPHFDLKVEAERPHPEPAKMESH